MRMSVLIVLFVSSASVATRTALVVSPPPESLPKAARDALNNKWRGWQIATVDPALSCLTGDAATSPMLVQADFDSDGHPDVAAAIQTPQGVRLVAMMSREGGYELFDLDALGDKTAAAYLRVESRGTKFLRPPLQVPDYFSDATLATYTCGGGHTVYVWSGAGFEKIALTK
jgi:hypothetical protein